MRELFRSHVSIGYIVGADLSRCGVVVVGARVGRHRPDRPGEGQALSFIERVASDGAGQ